MRLGLSRWASRVLREMYENDARAGKDQLGKCSVIAASTAKTQR
jgi:hypothetical protein